eukprot:s3528_g7.t1
MRERNSASRRSWKASQLLIASLAIGTCNVAVTFVRGFQGCSQTPSRKARSAVLAGEQRLTVAVLKEKLRQKGLSTTGLKQALVERLQEAEAETKPAAGYAKLTVAQLKAKCAELDLPKSGRKADLVARLEAKAASQASHGTASSKFLVGDRVMALYEEEQKEYEALVQCHNGDESYLITWIEDGYEHKQDASNMRLLQRRDKPFRFSAGEKVEGLFHDEDRWYAARVKCVNDSGSYTVIWDEDGEEYELAEKDLKPSMLPTPLSDFKPGQKLTGTVARTFGFGTFVDVGAERDGLLKPWFTFKGEDPSFKQGDKVKALYDEEEEYYAATVQKDNGDGTFDIVWEEDDCEYMAEKSKMELLRLAELEEGSKVTVYVESVKTDKDGQQKLWLALVKDKIGTQGPKPMVDLSGFTDLSTDLWLRGTVTKILNFGAFVRVEPPTGEAAQGLVHVNEVRDGFIKNLEEELSVDDEVQVRVKYVDASEGVLQLSMIGS